MVLIGPCGDAGVLNGEAHRAPMIRAIEQEPAHERRISRDAARTETGSVGSLRKAGKHQQAAEVVAAEPHCGLQSPEWRRLLVVVDFGIALVRRNHEAVAIRLREQLAPFVERQYTTGRITRRTDVHQLRRRHSTSVSESRSRENPRSAVWFRKRGSAPASSDAPS